MAPPPPWRPARERGRWSRCTRRALRIRPQTQIVREGCGVAWDPPSVDVLHREMRGAMVPCARRKWQSEAETTSCTPRKPMGNPDVCPSCNARRMAEVAAHLVDEVLPVVPARQWVLAVPKRLRYFPHSDAAAKRLPERSLSREREDCNGSLFVARECRSAANSSRPVPASNWPGSGHPGPRQSIALHRGRHAGAASIVAIAFSSTVAEGSGGCSVARCWLSPALGRRDLGNPQTDPVASHRCTLTICGHR
jgi:hypothetical protein